MLRVGRANHTFQRLEVLARNRTARHRSRELVVEGVKAITRARGHGWTFRALAYAAGRPLSSWVQETLSACPGAVRVELAPHLMAALSDKDDPSELIAVLAMPNDSLDRLRLPVPGERAAAPLVVVFDRPTSPGNLGAIIRSCDALGADGLVVTGHGADIYDPQTVRASLGSLFALPTVWAPSHQEVAQWLAGLSTSSATRMPGAAGPFHIVGGDGAAPIALDQADLTGPTVLVVGNETRGLSRAYREWCDTLVRVPMQGTADSLNVACAASILLYEASRQRRAAGGG